MLVLTRKKNQSILIDDHIEITIVGIEEGKVKVGISAPKDVTILRKEVYLEIQEENKKAASGSVDLQSLKNLIKNKKI
ncbi:carbon storage regulator CsrA [Anaeromicrobium sediminis]|uniref:Translational regulator CsrA n=1 Tax=Anaeromicrobium sediminis TaxID=1478221 RepID=A0A267MKF6_9FIRM|nr:carbon storage regulator CsrA [Anaeromicrobium sediminis]PAB59365.1 carbon storage regulator [Anaeromicrobium sediminis]